VSTDRTNDIEEAASEWLIRRDSGQWTPTDQERFEQWLEAATLNRVTFLRLELAWEESARLKALGAGIPGDQPPPPGSWTLTPFFNLRQQVARVAAGRGGLPGTRIGRGKGLALAASLLFAIVVASGAYQFWDRSGERYTTVVGGIASVPILDGSKITLNTNSQVRVALTQAERHIDLKQGEAFFEVAHDASRPFVVEAGNKRVVAVGTKFSVQRDGDSIVVVVTEGKVRLEDADAPLRSSADVSGSATARGADAPVFLTAGAIARANDAGLLVQHKSLAEAETRLSWRSGVLMFRELPLAEAVAEFNRYNVRQIVIEDPAVATLKVEGNFRAANVEAFVRLLESGFPVRASVQADRIVIGPR